MIDEEVAHVGAPVRPLTDGLVTLRLPSLTAGDVDAIAHYAREPGGLDGVWLPGVRADDSAQRARWLLEDWLAGWAAGKSFNGPALLLMIATCPQFVGLVGFGEVRKDVVEMVYGIAPRWRRRGLAARAARLAARWVLEDPRVGEVELRIAATHHASRRVAVKAGFAQAATVTSVVVGTGAVFEDLRYVLTSRAPAGR